MKIAVFETCLTDEQWEFIKPLLPLPAKLGRPPTDRRAILNAIFYLCKGGIQWRLLPLNFPPWKTVYHVYNQWKKNKIFAFLNDSLRDHLRKATGKQGSATAAILDSQTVKSDCHGGSVGYDAAKKIKGRKRHLLVDTLGMLLGIFVTPANVPERKGAEGLLKRTLSGLAYLKVIWVDGGYGGPVFAHWVKTLQPGLEIQVVKRSDKAKEFKILPRRWIVERTFGWLMRNRRLARDYEITNSSAEAWACIAMIRLQIRRLA